MQANPPPGKKQAACVILATPGFHPVWPLSRSWLLKEAGKTGGRRVAHLSNSYAALRPPVRRLRNPRWDRP